MKKMINIITIGICVLFISGCGAKERMIECTLSEIEENYEISATYKIYATGDIVNKVETTEQITSEDLEYLERQKNVIEEKYKKQNETYGGYTYHVTLDGMKLQSNFVADYSKVNMDKLVSDNEAVSKIVDKKNRITVEGAISAYKTEGAICK